MLHNLIYTLYNQINEFVELILKVNFILEKGNELIVNVE